MQAAGAPYISLDGSKVGVAKRVGAGEHIAKFCDCRLRE